MNPREWAVYHAALGMRVFRLRYGTKNHFIDRDWATAATSDPSDVMRMWTGPDGEPLNYNIGVLATGYVYLDVDTVEKTKGRVDGFASLEHFSPLPKTYSVRTPSGGVHLYFKTTEAFGAHSPVKGVDVRATNGYVVGAGSTFEAQKPGDISGTYMLLDGDAGVADLPEHVAVKLRSAGVRKSDAGNVVAELDTAAAKEAARAYLAARPPAIEGEGGDAHTYATVAAILDFGLSDDVALELLQPWNARCEPPWTDEELATKIDRAKRYKQRAIGSNAPTAGFGEVVEPNADDIAAERFRRLGLWSYDATPDTDAAIPRRPWIVPGQVIREAVTVLGGYGSVGKSLWSLQLAVAIASGRPGLGFDVVEPAPVLVVNNEDSRDEMSRRLAAVFDHFRVPREAAWGRIKLLSGHRTKFKIVRRQSKFGTATDGEFLADMHAYCRAERIGCIILDPLASIHEMAENDNGEMQRVMERLTGLAAETKAAVVVMHHTNKPQMASSESYAGNVNSLRGASAIKDAARVAMTMFGMSPQDAEKYGVGPHERHRMARIDDAKANLHLASPDARWYRRETVVIGNGEAMGVLQPVELTPKPKASSDAGAVVIDTLDRFTASEIVMSRVVAELQSDPVFRGKSRDAIAAAIRREVDASESYSGDWTGRTGGVIVRKS